MVYDLLLWHLLSPFSTSSGLQPNLTLLIEKELGRPVSEEELALLSASYFCS